MGTIKSIEKARALNVAREILQASIRPGEFIWKRHIRYAWQSPLKRDVWVVLLPNLELRVTDYRSGELITQGPAWVEGGVANRSR